MSYNPNSMTGHIHNMLSNSHINFHNYVFFRLDVLFHIGSYNNTAEWVPKITDVGIEKVGCSSITLNIF